MKVIDLLNKIANGETPNKIIYLPYATNNVYAGKYSYEQGDYLKDGWSNMWLFKDHLKARLNNEVEIIEEENKKYKNQQKEFISYLENMLDNENDIFSVVRVKDVLSKYKEIIGE